MTTDQGQVLQKKKSNFLGKNMGRGLMVYTPEAHNRTESPFKPLTHTHHMLRDFLLLCRRLMSE